MRNGLQRCNFSFLRRSNFVYCLPMIGLVSVNLCAKFWLDWF